MNKIAVIDIGSNSVRLMMLANGKVLYKTIKTTRLGEGLAFSPLLKDEAMSRTVEAVASFVRQAKEEQAEKVYGFATAAVRAAKNGQVFVERARAACGLQIEVISGEREAEIGILGAIGAADGAIVDIGGASTELIIQKEGKIVYEKSLNIGVVRIKDLCGRAQEKVQELALKTVQEYGEPRLDCPVYAIGGTATTLAAISLGIPRYESSAVTGAKLSRKEIRALADKLFSMSVDEIKKIPCVDELRADVLAGGVEWLWVIMEALKIEEIIVSDGDNLEGFAILKGLMVGQ